MDTKLESIKNHPASNWHIEIINEYRSAKAILQNILHVEPNQAMRRAVAFVADRWEITETKAAKIINNTQTKEIQ